ncbi:MAG: PKD domain-containing protein [bacterium]|nr:PKD domain-containing protein [bacterium]
MRKALLIIIALLPLLLLGQNCKINTATNKVCLGNTLLFTVSIDPGFTPTSYAWNFGNAASSTQPSPVYQYPSRGKFVPTLTVTFSNASTCTLAGDTIYVVDNPKANFNVITALTQCFKGNNTCVKDISTPGLDNAAINSRLFLYGDGGFTNLSPVFGDTLCHTYTNPLGGVYTLVLEVYDVNNCTSRKELVDHVTVFSKMQDISFKTTYNKQCNTTPVTFINTSKMPLSQLASYQWSFGDGQTAASPWTNFVHNYTASGLFTAKLTVLDKNGCKDSFVLTPAGENYRIDSTIYLSQISSCYNGNGFVLNSKNSYPGAAVYWAVYKVGSPNRLDTNASNLFVDSINFDDCGEFQIRMYVRIGNCFVKSDTTVKVYGPKSVIELRRDPIINSIQCEVSDTVYFRTPTGDNSCYYGNGAMYRLWDFDDSFAPNCTTDTKGNINVGVNCRYSKDSVWVKHQYKIGEDKCYYPKLILGDPTRPCYDTSTTALKLTQPDAGWDSIATPIRPGLTYQPAKPCLNSVVTFDISKTLPSCGREMAWYKPDSACAGAVWIPVDTLVNIFTHVYNTTCDPSGNVTFGLIIKNGKDKNGKDCYDTAWYHYIFKFFPLNPLFTAVRTNTGCGPFAVKVTMADSIQDSLKTVVINFNAPGGVRTLNYGPNDSIIPSQYYTYTTPGIKRITVNLTNTRNCSRSYDIYIYFGFLKSFRPEKPLVCLSDSALLIDDISYYNSSYAYWRDPARKASGFEQMYWDFGDGGGFVASGPLPMHKYKRVGNYRLRMVAIDSLGCRDTFNYGTLLKVVDVDARIKPMLPRYLCAPQILSFVDQSFYADSSSLYGAPAYDYIKYWTWEFGDNKPLSLLQNPVHDFTANGSYQVKLLVETNVGCRDSTFETIWIDGPRPKFDIVSDTVGCAPFEVVLKNTTGYPLINWVWYFRDQNNATASTQIDTNVKHVYTKAGIYKLYLVGEDTIYNSLTGQYKTCLSVFPDSLNINAARRTIRVIESVKASIEGPDTICVGVPFQLIAHPDRLVPGFGWLFGDTTPVKQTLYPDTVVNYTYNFIGTYKVKMYPILPGALCTDTAELDITTTTVMADFEMDQDQIPLIKFQNKSQGAVRYDWNFGQPSSGQKNFSRLENPTHNFVGDSGSFVVCLIAYNQQDCWDSICKRTLPAEMRIIMPNVFTPDGDQNNDAYDIDIVGYTEYALIIYNRWGNVVFETNKDGFGNDGINWNGKNRNNGLECPEGVYYFVFKYQMLNQNSPQSVHGTITLMRGN